MATKKEQITLEVGKILGAGKSVSLDTVDFNDPNRAKTCLEVDFPILRINELAAIEASSGATKKPIYQAGKWWARRQPSVFRSTLIAAATKAPEEPSHAAKLVWDNYYANHQKKGAYKDIKVADIFMGGGTTIVEGSRLGMQMVGNDLNPVAWFVVKQELAKTRYCPKIIYNLLYF
jgi:adenine-specific DNA methylase